MCCVHFFEKLGLGFEDLGPFFTLNRQLSSLLALLTFLTHFLQTYPKHIQNCTFFRAQVKNSRL